MYLDHFITEYRMQTTVGKKIEVARQESKLQKLFKSAKKRKIRV